MADVEMPDAGPSGAAKTKEPAAKSKAGGEVATDGKKRFEVKKVVISGWGFCTAEGLLYAVERCSSVGMGYCCRQLCNLS
jgi:hypothetical protein